ncbi:MAG: hypothetical protein R3E65_11670 [Steroidobacteraceae bacterium]
MTAGGGLGATHGDAATYPRLADVLGFIAPEQTLAIAEAIDTAQRDPIAATASTRASNTAIETMGLAAFKAEVERRASLQFAPARPLEFKTNGDRFGWTVARPAPGI